MKKIKEIIEYQIPDYFLPLIFNADYSCLDDEEIEQWENFERKENINLEDCVWEFPSNYVSYFSPTNDVNKLGGEIYDLKLIIFKEV